MLRPSVAAGRAYVAAGLQPCGKLAAAPFAALVAVATLVSVAAQSPVDRGRAALDRALTAVGGANALRQLDHFVVAGRGRENLSAEWQGLESGRPTWRDHEDLVVVAGDAVAWERRTPRNDLSLRWRRFIHSSAASGFVDWNAGRGRLSPPGTPAPDRRALARRIPHVLLQHLAAPDVTVRWLREQRLGGEPHDAIEVRLADAPPMRAFVANATGTIGRLEYDVFLPGVGDTVVSWSWRGWTRDQRLGWRPRRQIIEVAGTVFQDTALTRYDAGAADAADFMRLPATLTPATSSETAPPPADVPATGEVAPGIHVRVIQGFTIMAVEFRDFVVAIEAPEAARGLEAVPAAGGARSGRVAIEQLAWLDAAFPAKPVRHLVVSHHHGDHIGGAPLFAARRATVITSVADEAAARHAVRARRTLAPWPAPPTAAPPTLVESVRDRRVITDGSRQMEIIRVGKNPHGADNLLVWLPIERLLFQGDLFYFTEGAEFPPSGRETMNRFFAGWLESRGIRPRAIYGVHNSAPAGPDALARMLRR